ncbi:MAG: hypothetical protein CL526_12655 [Aequorivita sp.]|nr:hypothetical protein [Aequorivita sp.]|tara:strand:+ start:63 stop:461 length:399 start_codon:yes stop_codon:yes gene_type:complete
MAVFNGTNIAISLGGTAIAHATECSVTLNQETIDVTTKDSSGARELIPGLKSGSMSVSGLQEVSGGNGIKLLTATFNTGAAVALIFDQVATSGETFSANGILTSLEMSGGTEDAPTYSASFELTGAITKGDT